MLLRVEKWIFIKPLFQFRWENHSQALSKFIVLWLMATSPVLLAAALTPVDKPDANIYLLYWQKLSLSFAATEQFVYTAAFIPPIIYLLIERYKEAEIIDKDEFRLLISVRRIFSGYLPIFWLAVFVLLLNIATFVSSKTNFHDLRATIFYIISVRAAPFVYMYALYCWYLSILDGTKGPEDFVGDARRGEDRVVEGLSRRLEA